ncbi:rab5 GDP/GTP exchange factor [Galendromus occidentalis]|uniref:Rab5 GDP/GTP exchange factor n=1 Tax=Galendromus occidentalis TaxID=34638 RepID=A0AAJ6QP20_9ACAR|nr:rab5 GDP/GTP exchange factor [Galendromus occidentalis]
MTSRRGTLLHVEDRDVYCRNGCQFYGNPEWEGYCSKCYKEIRAKKQLKHSQSETRAPTDFLKFEEKKSRQKSNKTLKNLIKRANTIKENATFLNASSGPVLRDKKASDSLALLSDDLHKRLGFKQELCHEFVKVLNNTLEKMEVFFKKNESMESMSDMVQDAYQLIYDKAIQVTESISATEAVELCEDFLISHTYDVLFGVLSSEEETRDLGVLQRIRSLHWVRAHHLDVEIDDIHPTVKEFMDEASTQLIFIDSKRSPREKLYCVIEAARNIFKMLQAAPQSKSQGGADDFLPAMIYVVLRANPPRLHTNIKLVTLFSAQSRLRSGESGYMFTNLCGAVNFIENLTAAQLQMPPEEFESYVSGKAVPTEDTLTEGARMMYHNMAALKELNLRQNRLADATQQLKITLESLQKDIGDQVDGALKRSQKAASHHEYIVSADVDIRCVPQFMRKKITRIEGLPPIPVQPDLLSPDNAELPSPLIPEVLHDEPALRIEPKSAEGSDAPIAEADLAVTAGATELEAGAEEKTSLLQPMNS